MPLHVLSTCAHHTYRCDDTRGCIVQFRPPHDEHIVLETCRGMKQTHYEIQCIKLVNIKINILRCTVSKISKLPVSFSVLGYWTNRTNMHTKMVHWDLKKIQHAKKKQYTLCTILILCQGGFQEQIKKKSVRLLLYTIENCWGKKKRPSLGIFCTCSFIQ